MATYKRAPITEAVFQLQFQNPLSARDLERIKGKLQKRFPKVEDRINFQVQVDTQGGGKVLTEHAGYQLTSSEGVDAIILQRAEIATSRLAPYDDWASFLTRIKDNFSDWTAVDEHPHVKRMGCRYINRIDVPNKQILGKDISGIFSAYVELPEQTVESMTDFGWRLTVVEAETKHMANVAMSSQGDHPLLEHQSFTLDIDVFKNGNIPLRFEDMWSIADEMRIAKNNLFEKMISSTIRELIS